MATFTGLRPIFRRVTAVVRGHLPSTPFAQLNRRSPNAVVPHETSYRRSDSDVHTVPASTAAGMSRWGAASEEVCAAIAARTAAVASTAAAAPIRSPLMIRRRGSSSVERRTTAVAIRNIRIKRENTCLTKSFPK
jgi:hypothetical protein